jgi:hypothetical protein
MGGSFIAFMVQYRPVVIHAVCGETSHWHAKSVHATDCVEVSALGFEGRVHHSSPGGLRVLISRWLTCRSQHVCLPLGAASKSAPPVSVL